MWVAMPSRRHSADRPTGEIVTIDHSLLRRVEEGDVDVEPDVDGVAAQGEVTERDEIDHAVGIL